MLKRKYFLDGKYYKLSHKKHIFIFSLNQERGQTSRRINDIPTKLSPRRKKGGEGKYKRVD